MLSLEDEEEATVKDPKIEIEDEELPTELDIQQTSSEKKKKRRTTKQLYKDKMYTQEQIQRRLVDNGS